MSPISRARENLFSCYATLSDSTTLLAFVSFHPSIRICVYICDVRLRPLLHWYAAVPPATTQRIHRMLDEDDWPQRQLSVRNTFWRPMNEINCEIIWLTPTLKCSSFTLLTKSAWNLWHLIFWEYYECLSQACRFHYTYTKIVSIKPHITHIICIRELKRKTEWILLCLYLASRSPVNSLCAGHIISHWCVLYLWTTFTLSAIVRRKLVHHHHHQI